LQWTTANTVALQLPSMILRDFSTSRHGRPVVICAPYALHGALIVDFASDHSIVEALQRGGLSRIYVTDWRSAEPDMRYFSIDSYLSDLNVAIDEIGAPVDLVGLCQGGWLSLVYAARFPEKVRRLVLVGSPVDVSAESELSRMVAAVPSTAFSGLVEFEHGIVRGDQMRALWSPAPPDIERLLQSTLSSQSEGFGELRERFRRWDAAVVNLPGTYYLQVVNWIFKENQIAEGRFVALGRRVNLADAKTPIFILTAAEDEIAPPPQTLAAARLVGTPAASIEMATEPCSHLGLFMGRPALTNSWRQISRWLASERVDRAAGVRASAG